MTSPDEPCESSERIRGRLLRRPSARRGSIRVDSSDGDSTHPMYERLDALSRRFDDFFGTIDAAKRS